MGIFLPRLGPAPAGPFLTRPPRRPCKSAPISHFAAVNWDGCAVVSPRASVRLPPGSVPRRVAIQKSGMSDGTSRVANRRTDPMARDPKAEAALALHRFGFGPRPGSIAAIASDPRGALLAELDKPNAGKVPDAGLLSSGAASRMASEFLAERAAKQKLETKR